MQAFWDTYKAPLTGGITWAVFFLTTFLARYKIPPGAWYLSVLRAILGAVVDNVPPATFKQVAAQATQVKKARKANLKAASLASMVCALLVAVGCGGTLQKQLNAILVAEHQAQTYEAVLAKMALDGIAALPQDQQAKATADFYTLKARLDDVLTRKDAALEDAIIADSTSGVNLGQLLSDVYSAIQAIVDLVKIFTPAQAARADSIGLSMRSMQAKVQLVK